MPNSNFKLQIRIQIESSNSECNSKYYFLIQIPNSNWRFQIQKYSFLFITDILLKNSFYNWQYCCLIAAKMGFSAQSLFYAFSMLYHAVFVLPCWLMLSHAVLCCLIVSHVVLCCIMLSYAVYCCLILYYAV